MLDELEEHKSRVERWRGAEYIGLPQKTLFGLDEATSGLRGLMVLAAAPNVGKTALAVQFGTDIVGHNLDACFLFVSLEMLRWEIYTRIVCRLAEVDWKTYVFGSNIIRGRNLETVFEEKEKIRIEEAEEMLKEWGNRVRVLDEENFPNPTEESICEQVQKLKDETGTKRAFVLIDYLQVFPTPDTEKIRSDLDADKYRIGAMKSLQHSLGDAVMVISESRKPSGQSNESWGGALADVMGAARGAYTPDAVFLFRPFCDKELMEHLGINDDENTLKEEKENLKEAGIAYNKLEIAKGRDGFLKDTFDLTFYYRRASFVEGAR